MGKWFTGHLWWPLHARKLSRMNSSCSSWFCTHAIFCPPVLTVPFPRTESLQTSSMKGNYYKMKCNSITIHVHIMFHQFFIGKMNVHNLCDSGHIYRTFLPHNFSGQPWHCWRHNHEKLVLHVPQGGIRTGFQQGLHHLGAGSALGVS